MDTRRASIEQAVGESTGRSAGIQADKAMNIDAKPGESGFKFQAATSDKTRSFHHNNRVALAATRVPIRISPARMSRRACSREAQWPRATSA